MSIVHSDNHFYLKVMRQADRDRDRKSVGQRQSERQGERERENMCKRNKVHLLKVNQHRQFNG